VVQIHGLGVRVHHDDAGTDARGHHGGGDDQGAAGAEGPAVGGGSHREVLTELYEVGSV
jgi:hypothetical protein